MTKLTFPQLPAEMAARFQAILEFGKRHPRCFEDPACPYPEDLKGLLLTSGVGSVAIPIFKPDADDGQRSDMVLDEVESTIEEMKGVERGLSNAETSEKIAFYRAKTQLLERWVALKEKLYSIKQTSDFQRLVVSTLEEFLDKDQIQKFKTKLKGAL